MDIFGVLISLVSGALGGNAAGEVLKDKSLGVLGNSIVGILGGGLGGGILQAVGLAASRGETDIGSLIAQFVGGGIGGGILMTIVGLIKNAMAKA
jgi:uncharacterized membrane protein YeaQ/YmgE (transglycosylase-associated protein family)